MAGAAVGNPLGNASEDEDGEDTDAVVVKDTFSRVRRVVCNEDGEVRQPIVLLQRYTIYGTVFVVLGVPVISIALNQMPLPSPLPVYVNGNVVHERLIEMVDTICMQLSMASLSRFPTELARTTRIEQGALAQLGLGTKRVAEREASKLRRWPIILAVIAFPIALYGLVVGSVVTMISLVFTVPVRMQRHASIDSQTSQTFVLHRSAVEFDHVVVFQIALQLSPWFGQMEGDFVDHECIMCCWWASPVWVIIWSIRCFTISFCVPCAMCWYHAMQVGSCLAKDDVVEAIHNVKPDALDGTSTEWNGRVAAPTIRL
eukprot:SAG31_NODE_1342_length_8700_cov_12.667829_1_plen_315_part_00